MASQKNKINLYNNIKKLCQTLEENGYKQRTRYFRDGEYKYQESNWVVYEDDPSTTFLGSLCHISNRSAFLFLKRTGALDIGVCWKCGASCIKNEYTFSSGKDISFYICKRCYESGLTLQNQVASLLDLTEIRQIENKDLITDKSDQNSIRKRPNRPNRISDIFERMRASKENSEKNRKQKNDTLALSCAIESNIYTFREMSFKESNKFEETIQGFANLLNIFENYAIKTQEKRGVSYNKETFKLETYHRLYNECFNLDIEKLKLDLPLFIFTNIYFHAIKIVEIFKDADIALKKVYFEQIYNTCYVAFPVQSKFCKDDTIEILDKFCTFLQRKF